MKTRTLSMILVRVQHVREAVGELAVLSEEARTEARGLKTRRARAEVNASLDLLNEALTATDEMAQAAIAAVEEAKNWIT